MRYYIGSCKIELTENIWKGYIVVEDLGYAIQKMIDEGLLTEDNKFSYEQQDGTLSVGDWYLNINLSEKQTPDVNGNTHSIIVSPPFVPQEQEESKGASGFGTPTPEKIEESKEKIKEQEDEIDIKDVPF